MKKIYPIGTICELDTSNYLVMITGYFINSLEDEIVTYDYEGYIYPFGTLSNNKILFNEKSIKTIIFEGYKNLIYKNFVNKYVNQIEEDEKNNIQNEEYSELTVYSDGDMTLIKNVNYDKLLIDKDGNVLIADEK